MHEQLIFTAQQQTQFIESLRGIQTIKLYMGESDRLARWQNAVVDTLNASIRAQTLALTYRMASFALFGLENVLIFWLGAREVMDGGFSIGMLLAFVAYKRCADRPLGRRQDDAGQGRARTAAGD